MIDFLQNFHSGWRYIVVVATVFMFLYFLYAIVRKDTSAEIEKRALKIWPRLIDFQILLGVLLLAARLLDNGEWYYGKFTGHWVTMLIAALAAHGAAIFERLNGQPSAQVRRMLGLALPAIVFVLVIIGLQAINLGLMERMGI